MEIAIGFGGVVLGAILGAGLSWLVNLDATKRERAYQEKEVIRQRREEAAATIRERMDEVDAGVRGLKSGDALIEQLTQAYVLVDSISVRAALIRDTAITARLKALLFGISVALDDAELPDSRGVNLWALSFSAGDLRAALDAYLLREAAPAPVFPTPEELDKIVADQEPAMPALFKEMRDRWRVRRRQG